MKELKINTKHLIGTRKPLSFLDKVFRIVTIRSCLTYKEACLKLNLPNIFGIYLILDRTRIRLDGDCCKLFPFDFNRMKTEK